MAVLVDSLRQANRLCALVEVVVDQGVVHQGVVLESPVSGIVLYPYIVHDGSLTGTNGCLVFLTEEFWVLCPLQNVCRFLLPNG
jgi:hypothetical protein